MKNQTEIFYKNIGIRVSMIIGVPVGLAVILLTLFAPTKISGEGFPTMGLIAIYGYSIIGLIISFIYALWYAGKKLSIDILNNEALLKTSFKYSLTVNKIIWTVFTIITIIQNLSLFSFLFLIPPVIAFLVSVGFTTISLGLFISYLADYFISKNIKQST